MLHSSTHGTAHSPWPARIRARTTHAAAALLPWRHALLARVHSTADNTPTGAQHDQGNAVRRLQQRQQRQRHRQRRLRHQQQRRRRRRREQRWHEKVRRAPGLLRVLVQSARSCSGGGSHGRYTRLDGFRPSRAAKCRTYIAPYWWSIAAARASYRMIHAQAPWQYRTGSRTAALAHQ